MYYAIVTDDDGYKVKHASRHRTYAAALQTLIRVTEIERAWKDDLKACCSENGIPLQDQKEEYETIKSILGRKEDWVLEDLQSWTLGSSNQNTVYIKGEPDNERINV